MKPLACQLNENPVKGVVWGTWSGLWAFHFKCVDETPDGPALVAAQIIYHLGSIGRFADWLPHRGGFFLKKERRVKHVFDLPICTR